jgi:hypothetical protein
MGMTSRSRKTFYEDSQSYETTGRISFSGYVDDRFLSQLSPAEQDAIRADIHASISQIPTMLNTMSADQQASDLIKAKEAIEAQSEDSTFGLAVSFDNLDSNIHYRRQDLAAYLKIAADQLQLVVAARFAGTSVVPSTKMTQSEHAFAASTSGAPVTQQEQWQLVGTGSGRRGSHRGSGSVE